MTRAIFTALAVAASSLQLLVSASACNDAVGSSLCSRLLNINKYNCTAASAIPKKDEVGNVEYVQGKTISKYCQKTCKECSCGYLELGQFVATSAKTIVSSCQNVSAPCDRSSSTMRTRNFNCYNALVKLNDSACVGSALAYLPASAAKLFSSASHCKSVAINFNDTIGTPCVNTSKGGSLAGAMVSACESKTSPPTRSPTAYRRTRFPTAYRRNYSTSSNYNNYNHSTSSSSSSGNGCGIVIINGVRQSRCGGGRSIYISGGRRLQQQAAEQEALKAQLGLKNACSPACSTATTALINYCQNPTVVPTNMAKTINTGIVASLQSVVSQRATTCGKLTEKEQAVKKGTDQAMKWYQAQGNQGQVNKLTGDATQQYQAAQGSIKQANQSIVSGMKSFDNQMALANASLASSLGKVNGSNMNKKDVDTLIASLSTAAKHVTAASGTLAKTAAAAGSKILPTANAGLTLVQSNAGQIAPAIAGDVNTVVGTVKAVQAKSPTLQQQAATFEQRTGATAASAANSLSSQSATINSAVAAMNSDGDSSLMSQLVEYSAIAGGAANVNSLTLTANQTKFLKGKPAVAKVVAESSYFLADTPQKLKTWNTTYSAVVPKLVAPNATKLAKNASATASAVMPTQVKSALVSANHSMEFAAQAVEYGAINTGDKTAIAKFNKEHPTFEKTLETKKAYASSQATAAQTAASQAANQAAAFMATAAPTPAPKTGLGLAIILLIVLLLCCCVGIGIVVCVVVTQSNSPKQVGNADMNQTLQYAQPTPSYNSGGSVQHVPMQAVGNPVAVATAVAEPTGAPPPAY